MAGALSPQCHTCSRPSHLQGKASVGTVRLEGGPCSADLLTREGAETSGAGRGVQGASRGHGGLTISPRTSFGLRARECGPLLPQGQCPQHRVTYMSPCSPPNPPGLSGIKPHPSCVPLHGAQHLEHSRGLIIDGGQGVGAQHTQVEPNHAWKSRPSTLT